METLSFPESTSIDEFWVRSTDFLTAVSALNAAKYAFLGNLTLSSISQLSSTPDTEMVIGYNPDLENLNGATGADIKNLTIVSSQFVSLGIDDLKRVYGNLRLSNTGLSNLDNAFPALRRKSMDG